jgi:hypothetical protein
MLGWFKAIFSNYEILVTKDFQFKLDGRVLTIDELTTTYKNQLVLILKQLGPKDLSSFQKSSKFMNDFIEKNQVWRLAFELKFKITYDYIIENNVDVKSYLDKFSLNPRSENLWKRYYEFMLIKIDIGHLNDILHKYIERNIQYRYAFYFFKTNWYLSDMEYIDKRYFTKDSIFGVNKICIDVAKRYKDVRIVILTYPKGYYITTELVGASENDAKLWDNNKPAIRADINGFTYFKNVPKTQFAAKYVQYDDRFIMFKTILGDYINIYSYDNNTFHVFDMEDVLKKNNFKLVSNDLYRV